MLPMLMICMFTGVFSGCKYKIVLKIKCLILSHQSCGKKYTKTQLHWYNIHSDVWTNNKMILQGTQRVSTSYSSKRALVTKCFATETNYALFCL